MKQGFYWDILSDDLIYHNGKRYYFMCNIDYKWIAYCKKFESYYIKIEGL